MPIQVSQHGARKPFEGRAQIVEGLNMLAREIHANNSRWWRDVNGEAIERNKGEMLMLMVSELSEAMEGERKDLMDDHLPNRKMVEVELADCMIRILDYCGGFKLDIGGALVEKLEYNQKRADHSYESRSGPNGKKF